MKRIYKTGLGPLLIAALMMAQTGCKKLVEPDPAREKVDVKLVYSNDKTAASVMTRLMADMAFISDGANAIPMNLALSGDDIRVAEWIDQSTQDIYFNNFRNDPMQWWYKLYNHIYTTNDAIEQLTVSTGTTEKVRNLLLGEAKFLRAFCYFYLVATYDRAPLVLVTDQNQTANLGRAPVSEIYQQIVKDLTEAKTLLSAGYLHSNMEATTTGDRFRPVKSTAAALLARTYLYMKEYAKAETEASEVIGNTALYNFIDLNNVFLKGSKEALWQLPVMGAGLQTGDGMKYILRKIYPTDPNGPTWMQPLVASAALLSAFEPGDLRATKWIADSAGWKFFNKYKDWDGSKTIREAVMMIRLGEVYLIRAEARIMQGGAKKADGIADLNTLRARARGANPGDLPDLSLSLTDDEAMTAILRERQVELFTEWGHRWYDLRRLEKIDEVMLLATPLKSGNTVQWKDFRKLWPIPAGEIRNSPGMRDDQNQGW